MVVIIYILLLLFTSSVPSLLERVSHALYIPLHFLCELAALLGVKLTPSTSYHPQTDGQMEHVNQEIEAYL